MRKYAINENTGSEVLKVDNLPIKWLEVMVGEKEIVIREMREGIIGEEVNTTHRFFSDSPVRLKVEKGVVAQSV